MKPYAYRKLLEEAPGDLGTLEVIEAIFQSIPDDLYLGVDDKGERIIISCHHLAVALSSLLDLQVVHGVYLVGLFEHSWLVTSNGNILDVYPVGSVGGPLLIDASAPMIFRQLYKVPTPEEYERRYGTLYTREFTAAVDMIVEFVRTNFNIQEPSPNVPIIKPPLSS